VLSAANFQVPRRIRQVTFLRDVVAAEYQVRFVTRNSPSNITRQASPNQVSNRVRRKSCSNSLMLADSQRVDQALRQFLYWTDIPPREDMIAGLLSPDALGPQRVNVRRHDHEPPFAAFRFPRAKQDRASGSLTHRERAEMPTICDQQHRLHLRCRSRIPATA